MATNTLRQSVAQALKEITIPTPFALAYGTAGFRCSAEKLKGVSVRVGVLAALRSLLKHGNFVGVMITASHNPAHDNGIKIVDPDGGMLDTSWEPVIIDFMQCTANLTAHWLEKKVEHLEETFRPNVVVGYDTRESSPSLAEEIVQGVNLMQGCCIHLGLVTTPQLHFAVRYLNTPSVLKLEEDFPYPDLDRIYVQHFVNRFAAGMNALSVESTHVHHPIELNVDCAHGVGSLMLRKVHNHLAEFGDSMPLRLHLFNTEVEKLELLNQNCGADFVKLTLKTPELYSPAAPAPYSPEARWATIDGDADRLLYFYHPFEIGPHGSKETQRIVLLDGDRIACLFASFLTKILHQSLPSEQFRVGVIQTAYANASSTLYLRDELNVTVLCVPTGVKHLHRAARDFDFGIYFEANGHGTVLFSRAVLEFVEKNLAPDHPLSVFISLTNTTVGDAITDILLVEFVLAWHGWSLQKWHEMYTELAYRQIKVSVTQPSSIQTTDAERRVCSPVVLQEEIDTIVHSVEQATKAPGKSRAFVRPSGTENIARVYAESIDQTWADWLARKVAVATHRIVGGASDQQPSDPGPMPKTNQ